MTYESVLSATSSVQPDVTFTVRRVSVARRLELLRRVRELATRLEFYRAGAQLDDKLDASIASAWIDEQLARD